MPVITTLHGTDITLVGADRSYLPITKYGLQQSDGVTAVSKFLKQATIETFDFDEIEVIPNFICPTHYKKIPDSPLRREIAPNGEKILVHLSNFRAVKRPVDCVEIFAKVLQKGGDAQLVFVGDGPEFSAVHHRAKVSMFWIEHFCRKTAEYCRLFGHCGRFAAAVGNRIFRSCRSRSASLRSSGHCFARRRNSRSRQRRRIGIFERSRQHGKNVRRRFENPPRRRIARSLRKKRTRIGNFALQCRENYSAIYFVL